ncbi:MAG: response regulator [Rhizobiales bacterium]|nr:response regulator [Hyphomicrobiales bacterium]
MLQSSRDVEGLLRSIKLLVVEDDYDMRKVIRSLLTMAGAKRIFEAADGDSGLEMARAISPDVIFVDWEMPGLKGPDFIKAVRAPGKFPLPDVPIVMLTGHVERRRVLEAMRLGVNEYLCKPVSAKTLHDRIVSVFANPRPMVRIGDYYGPAPRKESTDPIMRAWAKQCECAWLD